MPSVPSSGAMARAPVGLQFFGPYFGRQQVDALKRDAEELHGLLRQLLDDVQQEQKARLRTIRQTGPWDPEREVAVRQQAERASQVLLRLRQYRQMRQRIRELEDQLPPVTGLNRLRYVNPWILTWSMAGLSVLVNCLRFL